MYCAGPSGAWAAVLTKPGQHVLFAMLNGPEGVLHGWLRLASADEPVTVPGVASVLDIEMDVVLGCLAW